MRRLGPLLLLCALIAFLVFGFAFRAETKKESAAAAKSALSEEQRIDLDLSALSGTAAYSLLLNMLMEPEAYLGKTMRISGWYDVLEDMRTGEKYSSCVIPDAAGCCTQGIEFLRRGEPAHSAEDPEPGAPVTVTGRVESYQEDGFTYLRLADADVQFE